MIAPRVSFDDRGLIPAVVQEAATGELLMLAWMNLEALEKTLATRRAHYWSRARGRLWLKGETSGHAQHVEAIYTDCDRDTLLLLVHQEGVACHTGNRSCFFTRVDEAGPGPAGWAAVEGILDTVERVIQSRKVEPREGSYVSRLLRQGEPAMLRKVGEEAIEVVVAALAEPRERLVAEVADLWFHTLVVLGARGIALREVLAELGRRHASRPGGPSDGDPEGR